MARKAVTTPAASADAGEGAQRPYTVLARRYRSRDFGEVVGQEPIARTLQNAIASGRTAHAYLFCGTRGVGKTSMARIFARALNRDPALAEGEAIGDAILRGEDLDVVEIDGASNRGIDDARDLIAGAGLAPTRGKYRIYVIDEVHMLTTPAFNALLKTMEEPPSHVKFILCTTEPHKVPQTIQSRCQRFDFRNIPTKEISGHLGRVAASEGVEVTEDVLLQVARLANGSMRDGLSLLDRLFAAANGRVDAAVVEQVFGLPDDEILLALVEACVDEQPAAALRAGAQLLERGSGVEQALELLAERWRWMLVAAADGEASDLLEVAASMRDRVAAIAGRVDVAAAAHAIALCDATARNARGSSAPRALYDACLVRLALSRRFASAASLLAGGGADAKKAGDPGARRAPGATLPNPVPTSVATPAPTSPPIAARTSASTPASAAAPRSRDPISAPAPAPASAPATQPARAPAPAAAGPVDSVAALAARLEDLASRSARDRAIVDDLEIASFHADGAVVRVRSSDASGRFLAANPEPIRSLVARAAGRPIRVVVEPPAGVEASAPRPQPIDDAAVRQDPLVRRASELFDAFVVAVVPRAAVAAAEQEASPADAPMADVGGADQAGVAGATLDAAPDALHDLDAGGFIGTSFEDSES